MKKQNLIDKLNKLGINHNVCGNGYNMNIQFSINGKTYDAGYTVNIDKIEDYSTTRGYDQVNQETERRFFKSFNEVLRYANSK